MGYDYSCFPYNKSGFQNFRQKVKSFGMNGIYRVNHYIISHFKDAIPCPLVAVSFRILIKFSFAGDLFLLYNKPPQYTTTWYIGECALHLMQ